MNNKYDVVLNGTVTVDAFKAHQKGELKLTKIGTHELEFDFDFPIVTFTEKYPTPDDREEAIKIIKGETPGYVS